jgi:hypothetical protein
MTWDHWLYFPSEGRSAGDFFALKNPTASAGFEPVNFRIRGQRASSRPPKPLTVRFCGKWAYEKDRELYNYLTLYDMRSLRFLIQKNMSEGLYIQRKRGRRRRRWLSYFWKLMHYMKFTNSYSINKGLFLKQYSTLFLIPLPKTNIIHVLSFRPYKLQLVVLLPTYIL